MNRLTALPWLLAAMGVATAAAPTAPCSPTPGASQAVVTVPAPTGQPLANTGAAAEERAAGKVQPQVAVHLKRGTPDSTALKPGKQAKPSSQMDDSAARCQATRP